MQRCRYSIKILKDFDGYEVYYGDAWVLDKVAWFKRHGDATDYIKARIAAKRKERDIS